MATKDNTASDAASNCSADDLMEMGDLLDYTPEPNRECDSDEEKSLLGSDKGENSSASQERPSIQSRLTRIQEGGNAEDKSKPSSSRNSSPKDKPRVQVSVADQANAILYGKSSLSREATSTPNTMDLLLVYDIKTTVDAMLERIREKLIDQVEANSPAQKEIDDIRANWLRGHCHLDRTKVAIIFRAIRQAEMKEALPATVSCVFCQATRCHNSSNCPQFPDLPSRLENFTARGQCFNCGHPRESCLLEPCTSNRNCSRCQRPGHGQFLCTDSRSVSLDTQGYEKFKAASVALELSKEKTLRGGPRWYHVIQAEKNNKKEAIRKISPDATRKKFREGTTQRNQRNREARRQDPK